MRYGVPCKHCSLPISRLNNCVHCDHILDDAEEARLDDLIFGPAEERLELSREVDPDEDEESYGS